MQSASPIALTVAEGFAAGARLWRQRGQSFVTIAVKATFQLVPGRPMVLCAPLPIEPVERSAAPGLGIETSGDLAPCLVQPEIWVRGHAFHPPPNGAKALRARLALARDATLLVSKTLTLALPEGPFVPPFLHGFAPLSQAWPIRAQHLGGLALDQLSQSPLDLPDPFDWSFFQAAPADQRVASLRGNEWIRLEGIHHEIQRFDTRLPSAWAAAVLFGQGEAHRAGLPIPVGLDSIQIDVDRGLCSLVFRGYVPLPQDEPIEFLQIAAAVALPDRPLPDLRPVGIAARPMQTPSSIPPPPRSEDFAAQTMTLDEEIIEKLAHQKATPFDPTPAPPNPSLPRPLPPPLPFPEPPPPLPVPGQTRPSVTIDLSPQEEEDPPFAATFALDEKRLAKALEKPAMPFTGGSVAPERKDLPPLPKVLPFDVPGDEPKTLGDHFLAAMAEHLHDQDAPLPLA